MSLLEISNCNACLKKHTCKLEKIKYKKYLIFPIRGNCCLFDINTRMKKPYYNYEKELDIKLIFIKLFLYKHPQYKELLDMDLLDLMKVNQAMILKNWGIETGKPDVSINIKNNKYSGICFEFKRNNKSKIRENQIKTLKALSNQNRLCLVIWDSFVAFYILNNYIENNFDDFEEFLEENKQLNDYLIYIK